MKAANLEGCESMTTWLEGIETGAGQGIGQGNALALAQRGAPVIAADLTRPNETVAKIGPSAYAFQLDVTQEESWRSVSLKYRDVGTGRYS